MSLSPPGSDPAAEVAVNAVVGLSRTDFDAVVMALDGVVTDTSSLHQLAWKRLFDGFLASLPLVEGEDHRPFDSQDYQRFVDGRSRVDGALGFLAARGVIVTAKEVRVLMARKDGDFREVLASHHVTLISGVLSTLTVLRRGGFRTAIVSPSRHCAAVLGRAGLTDLFDVSVDGVTAADLVLAGEPYPAVYLEAAGRLRTPPERSVVIENALAGVEAGRRGGFGLVVGVGRPGHEQELLDHGADLILPDLAGVQVTTRGAEQSGCDADAGLPISSWVRTGPQ